jgi:hypothetical protein
MGLLPGSVHRVLAGFEPLTVIDEVLHSRESGGLAGPSYKLFLFVTDSVTRLGESSPLGYFLLGHFFVYTSSFKTWFNVLILPFKRSLMQLFSLSIFAFIIWLQFGLHFQKLGKFFIKLLVTL